MIVIRGNLKRHCPLHMHETMRFEMYIVKAGPIQSVVAYAKIAKIA